MDNTNNNLMCEFLNSYNEMISKFKEYDMIFKTHNDYVLIKYDSEIPSKDIVKFCEYINIPSTKFTETVDQHRNKEIWKKTANGWDLKNQISYKIIDEN